MSPSAAERVTMNRLLVVLLAAVVLIGASAFWRGSNVNTSQPHVPTWKSTKVR